MSAVLTKYAARGHWHRLWRSWRRLATLTLRRLCSAFSNIQAAGKHWHDAGERRELERKVHERTTELEATELRLANVLASMRDLVYSTNLDFDRFLYISPVARKLVGEDCEALLHSPRAWLEIIDPRDQAKVQATMDQARATQKGEVRYRILRQDGTVRWHSNRFHTVFDDAGQAVHIDGIVCDITERVQAREAHIAAEAALRLRERALASSNDGIVISDLTQPDEPIIYVNPAFERITGYSAHEVVGRNCRFLQGPETDPAHLQTLRAAIRSRSECTLTLLNYRKDGTPFWNRLSISPVPDADGSINYYVGAQTDVSEIELRDRMIREWAFRQEVIFTLTPDGFITFDRNGTVEYANPGFERMTGLLVGQLVGSSMAKLEWLLTPMLADNSPPAALCDWVERHDQAKLAEALLDDSVEKWNAPVLLLAKPTTRVLQVALFRCDSDSTATVLHLRDITREREVDRMKSEFLSTAAHELRTPMASIMGFSELLLHREFPPEAARDMLETIHRQSQRLTHLLNELLDLARIEARRGQDFKFQQLSVVQWVDEAVRAVCCEDYRASLAPYSLPNAWVQGDQAKLQQALLNVLSNAFKYSPQGGVVTVQLVEHKTPGWVGLQVSDQGIGMSADHLARVFERFFRADASGAIPGTGLGMSLVKEIIELHGGEVRVESALGAGTTVTLWLPGATAEHDELASIPQ